MGLEQEAGQRGQQGCEGWQLPSRAPAITSQLQNIPNGDLEGETMTRPDGILHTQALWYPERIQIQRRYKAG